jgi:hypothetical protein
MAWVRRCTSKLIPSSTVDLFPTEKMPGSGQREVRVFKDLKEAQACYQCIYNEKTGPKKGYKPVQLHSSNIGSEKVCLCLCL